MRLELHKRNPLPAWQLPLLPLLAIALAFILSAFLIRLAGGRVFEAWGYILSGSLGSRFAFLETLVKMTPLCLTGLSVTIAFRTKFWNIGAEGQLYVGAMVAALVGILPLGVPRFVHIAIMILGGFVAGGLWAMVPGILRVRFKVDDVVLTLMLNYVVIYVMGAILDTVWRDEASGWPHSPEILEVARYPQLLERSRFHFGFVVAVVAAVVLHVVIHHTKLGFRLRAIGHNDRASNYAGVNVPLTVLIVAFISGGIAGLAGVGEVAGMQYYLVEGISPGYGYYGVAIAMLAALEPLGVLLSSFFFAVVVTGSQVMSRYTGVPVYLSEVLQGLTLITMMAAMLLNRYKIAIRRRS